MQWVQVQAGGSRLQQIHLNPSKSILSDTFSAILRVSSSFLASCKDKIEGMSKVHVMHEAVVPFSIPEGLEAQLGCCSEGEIGVVNE